MKKLIIITVIGLWSFAVKANVTITNLVVAQRLGTKLVDITYDIFSDITNAVPISLIVKNATNTLPSTHSTGDIRENVLPATNRHVVWDAGADWNGSLSDLSFTLGIFGTTAPAEMVTIPAGTNSGTDPDFGAYSLTVTNTFFMDATEVTKAKWDAVRTWALTNGYSFTNAGAGKATNHPVQTVNWYDTVKWCNARSQMEGRTPCYTTNGAVYRTGQNAGVVCSFSTNGYRLPTSAEWEYAARGGLSGKRFPWGDAITHSNANYYSTNSYSYDVSPTRGYNPAYTNGATPYTSPVGSFAPNGYGLYDMAGNVWEFCWDAMGANRNAHGGSWYNPAYYAQCGLEGSGPPSNVDANTGFRAICNLDIASTNPLFSSSATAAVDSRNYTLTIASEHGTPTPSIGTNLYAWCSVVTCSVASAVIEQGVNWRNTGWSGTGSVPLSGLANTTGVILLTNLSSSITWNWQTSFAITNITAVQRAGTKLVDITYDIISDVTNAAPISLVIKNATNTLPSTHSTGDIGENVLPATNRHVVWDAGADWNGNLADLTFTLSVTTTSSISPVGLVLSDDFESSTVKTNWQTSGSGGAWVATNRTGTVHSGNKAFVLGGVGSGNIFANARWFLPTPMKNGRVSWWHYDDAASNSIHYSFMYACDVRSNYVAGCELEDRGWGGEISGNFRTVAGTNNFGSKPRTIGWHKYEVRIDQPAVSLYIDDQFAVSGTTDKSIGMVWFGYQGYNCGTATSFFDDLTIESDTNRVITVNNLLFSSSAVAAVDSRDYKLTINSAHGTPSPSIGTNLYALGTVVTCSVPSSVVDQGINWRNTGWSGTGDVPVFGSTNATGAILLTNISSSITWNWETSFSITNVVATQRLGTKLVDITYDIISDVTNEVPIMLKIKNGTTNVVSTSSIGDIGSGVLPSNGKQILWNAGLDWNGNLADLIYTVGVGGAPAGMIAIPAGTNSGTDLDFGAYSLTVTNTFFMDATEVTKAKWDAVRTWALTNGYSFDNVGSGKATNHPVNTVSWYDTVKWCNARSQMEGRTPCYTTNGAVYRTGQNAGVVCSFSTNGYRLPTSAEWEYAARGGLRGKRFPWGDTITHSNANYCSSSLYSYDVSSARGYHAAYTNGGLPYTSPVGSFTPNGYGLYDMAGNVWEWCWDSSGSGRRLRGSAWSHDANNTRCGYAYWPSPANAGDGPGFRSVCNSGATSTNLLFSSSATTAVDCRDYKLTVTSAHGAPTPNIGTNLYAWGSVVTCSADAVVEYGVDWQSSSWTGTGDIPASGTTNTTEAILLTNLSSSIIWEWNWQTALTITNSDNTITITGYTGSGSEVTIPLEINGVPVTAIGPNAFAGCTSLTSVTIPSSLIGIGDYAFQNCPNLTSVVIGNQVVNIGDNAFQNCARLIDVTIPNSVTNIGAYAFQNCSGLTNFMIGSGVRSIGAYALESCVSLTEIRVDSANSFYSSTNGVLFNKNQTMIIQYSGGKTGSYTIPSSVTNIGTAAFSSCIGLSNITIPDSIVSIGNGVFFNCANLITATISGSVTNIGTRAFSGCPNLTGVYFLGNAPSLGSNVFIGDNKATVYYLPDTTIWGTTFGGRPAELLPYTYSIADGKVTITAYVGSGGAVTVPSSINGLPVIRIGNWAFTDSTGLTSVTIPSGITSIGDWAFAGCTGLTSIYFQGNPPLVGLNVFYGDNNATVYYSLGATGWGSTFGDRPAKLWMACFLFVNGGSGSGTYTNQQQVTITANAMTDGMAFDRWTGATQYVANVTSLTAIVTMPLQAISLTATYKGFEMMVTGGSGAGSYTNQQQILIVANEPPIGQAFDRWIGDSQYAASITSSTTTITMPAKSITLIATYKGVYCVTPDILDFGTVQLGTFAERTFVIQNNGTNPLVYTVSAPNPYSVAKSTNVVAAGSNQNVAVRYSPTAGGIHTQTVTFGGGGLSVMNTVTGNAKASFLFLIY